jgi:hypothetical protein
MDETATCLLRALVKSDIWDCSDIWGWLDSLAFTEEAELHDLEIAMVLFALLVVGLVLMLLKDLSWLATPHLVSLGIAWFCLVLAVVGLATYPKRKPEARRRPGGARHEAKADEQPADTSGST